MFNLRENEKKDNFPLQFSERIRKKVKLDVFTSFKIGGYADIYSEPSSPEELADALAYIRQTQLHAILLGGGSNVLIPDEGIRGAVIHTHNMNRIKLLQNGAEPHIEAEAGVSMRELTEFCDEQGLTGLEDFAGLPGTVGGAVFMNARCYEKSIADVLISVSVMHFSEKQYIIEEYGFRQEAWAYKQSPFQPPDKRYTAIGDERKIIVSATFKTAPGNKAAIRTKMDTRIADRTEKGHFRLPSAGSVFKNNRAFGKPSGKLIEEAGLRGLRIGGAQIAPWHGNFIVNTGSATAHDVMELVKTIQTQVKAQTGFELEPEMIFAG